MEKNRNLLTKLSKISIVVPQTGQKLVRDVSFELSPGEITALIGHSGAGKSLVASLLSGLLDTSELEVEGELRLGGQEILKEGTYIHTDFRGKKVGMVFQNPAASLNPLHTIRRHFKEIVRALGEEITEEELDQQMVSVDLNAAFLDRYPHELSGGQQQRVAILLALITDPDLVIADEAVTALDPELAVQIMKLLVDSCRKKEKTLLIISHNLPLVLRLVDRVLLMQNGVLLEDEAREKWMNNPQSEYGERLLKLLQLDELELQDMSESLDLPLSLIARKLHYGISKSDSWKFWKQTYRSLLEDVSFSIREQEIIGIAGPSGSGKTTLARILSGLVQAESGDIKSTLERVRMIFQNPMLSFDPLQRIGSALEEAMTVNGVGISSQAHMKGLEALEEVGLNESHYQKLPSELSGGEIQRVAIARALVVQPDLLICDEPTANLDWEIRNELLDMLWDVQQKRGFSMIIISHDMYVLRKLAHRLMVVEDGKSQGLFEWSELEKVESPALKRMIQAEKEIYGK